MFGNDELKFEKDYILKLDNIEEESNHLFKKLGIQGIKYPKGYGHKSSNSILNEISGEISIRTGKNQHSIQGRPHGFTIHRKTDMNHMI